MKVAVTDANIFIDLINLKLIQSFFEFDFEAHTSLDVLEELYDHQKEVLLAYQGAKKLTVHNLSPEDIDEMHAFTKSNKLSDADKSVIYLAHKEKAMLLSSDGPARKIAKEKNIETHGLVWLFDEFVQHKIISPKVACTKINELLETNRRYKEDKRMIEEFEKRLTKWQKN